MHWIDWAIVIGLLVLLTAEALYAKRYMNSVAGFIVASRLCEPPFCRGYLKNNRKNIELI